MCYHQRINELVEAQSALLTELSEQIWNLAELRFEEHRSAEVLCRALEENGFRVQRGAGGIATAFVAEFGSGAPVIGFLGEYDALPGLSQQSGVAHPEPVVKDGPGHGCGHNLLGTGALAAALALRFYAEENGLPGTVRYYGCPAEEGGGGKVLMVAAGLFDDVDVALTWHPSDAHYVHSSSTLATRTVTFRFQGKSAHAAKTPHLGRSALDAVELTNVGANYLREHVPSEARIHYAITQTGGNAPNVVQAEAAVRYQLRAPLASQVAEVYARVCDVARGAALMTGTQLETRDETQYLNVIPNTTLEGCMHAQLEALGLPEYDETDHRFAREIRATFSGAEKNEHRIPETRGLELAEKMPPYRPHMSLHFASTDVGDVSWVVPTAQYRGATWAVGTQPHSWQAVAQGICSYAHKGMLHAGKVLAATGAAVLQNPPIVDEAKTELKAALGAADTGSSSAEH